MNVPFFHTHSLNDYFMQAGTGPTGEIPVSLILAYTCMGREFIREAKIQVQIHSYSVQVGILAHLNFIQ